MEKFGRPQVRRRVGRRHGDPLPAVLDAVGLAGPRRRRVRRRRRRDRGGGVLQRVPRRRGPGRARGPTPPGTAATTAASPTTSAWSTWPTPGVQGRGVLVDLAHHLGHDWRGVDLKTLQEIMAADDVVVEPGDMLLLHTGFATEVLAMEPRPGPREDPHAVQLPRRPGRVPAAVDQRLADLGTGGGQLRRRGPGRQGSRRESALVPAHPPPLPVPARASPWARCGTSTSWRRGCGSMAAAGSCSRRRRCGCPASWAPR